MGLIVDAYITHPDIALKHTIEALSEISIRVVPHSATDPETDLFFFRVSEGDFDEFEAALSADPTVAESSLMMSSAANRVYQLRHTPETKLVSPHVVRAGGVTLEARSHSHGWIVRLQLPDREALANLWERCETMGITFKIERVYQQNEWEVEDATGLTAAQRDALLAAYEEGYFEEPRKTSQEEIADLLDISSTAAGGRIRRGVAKLIETTLVDHEEC